MKVCKDKCNSEESHAVLVYDPWNPSITRPIGINALFGNQSIGLMVDASSKEAIGVNSKKTAGEKVGFRLGSNRQKQIKPEKMEGPFV
jgi:hypothetical protein